MGLFLKQTEQRTQLQEKVASDLMERTRAAGNAGGNDDVKPGEGILEESQEATGRSIFWVSVVTMVVIALVVFVLFIFNGI